MSKKPSSSRKRTSTAKKEVVLCPDMIDAAMYGKLARMKEIAMADPKNLQARETDGWTIAHWAARRGHLDILSYIADRAPTLLSAQADDGASPAHFAAAFGHDSVLNLLGDRDPGSLMVNDKEGNSPAHDATKHNRLTTLKLLVDRCPSLIYGMNKEQQRPCDFAIREEIKAFLKDSEKASMVPAVQLQNLAKETRTLNAQNAVLAFQCRNYWDAKDRDLRVVRIEPPPKDEVNLEYQSVIAEFLRTMSKCSIDSLHRFQDRRMHQDFMAFREDVKAECGSHYSELAMEKWVFYTAPDLVATLNKVDGSPFVKKTSKSTGGAPYGDGIYVYREASLAAETSYPDAQGNKQVLIARCATGRFGQGKSGMEEPMLIPGSNTKRFHSNVDNISEPMTYVLQTKEYLFPAYVVLYKE